jgi:signal transduction histidine kinase
MKKYFSAYAILIIMIFAGVLLASGILKNAPKQEIDSVEVNRIVKQASQNWENLEKLSSEHFIYQFSIIDNDYNVLYKSNTNMPNDLQEAIKRGFLPMNIVVGRNPIAQVLIETIPSNAKESESVYLSKAVIIAFTLICILSALFLFALHSLIIKPFHRLQSFAHKISIGNFDEPLPMDKNNLFGLFTQSFDIMRTSLQEERHNRLKAERAKKELIASLSHDIRTPVTSIRAYAELLQLGNNNENARSKLKAIEKKTEEITRLMSDLMQSTLEELEELKVNPVPSESRALQKLFENADHLNKMKIGEIPSCLIELDANRFEQVIGNIVSNSYKYALSNIDVDFKICDELLKIDISDYGSGVDPEELSVLTTKFYRGKNAKTMKKDGEGLGLYVAALLMEKSGGELSVYNRNDGFTVSLLLPISR